MDSREHDIIIVREVIDLDSSTNKVVVDLCNEEHTIAFSAPQDKMENDPDMDEADFQVLDCWEGEDDEVDENEVNNHSLESKPLINTHIDKRKGNRGTRASGYDSDETVIFEDLAHIDDCESDRRKQAHVKERTVKSQNNREKEPPNIKKECSSGKKECPPSTSKEKISLKDHQQSMSKTRVSSSKGTPPDKSSQPSHKDRHPSSKERAPSTKDHSSALKDRLTSSKLRKEEHKENSIRDRSAKNQRSIRESTKGNFEENDLLNVKCSPTSNLQAALEMKIDNFLKETALHHAQKTSLIDPSDLPPGVDLDQVGMDTSTSSLLSKKVEVKQAPKQTWEGPPQTWDVPVENDSVKPQRIAGRLYADYSKIMPKEDEMSSKPPHTRQYEWEGDEVRLSQSHRAPRNFSSRSPSPNKRHAPQVKSRAHSRSPRMRRYSRSPVMGRRTSPFRVHGSQSPSLRLHRVSRSPSPRKARRSKSPRVRQRSRSRSGPRHMSRSPSRGRNRSNSSSKYRKFSRSDHALKHLSPVSDERISSQSQFTKSPTIESALRALSRSLSRERLRHRSRSKSRTRTFSLHSRGSRRRSPSPDSRSRKFCRSRSRSVSPPSRVKPQHLSRSRSQSRSRSRSRSSPCYRSRRKRSSSVETNKAKRVCLPPSLSPTRSRGRSPWRPPVEAPKEEWSSRFAGVNGIPLLEEVKLEHDMERFIATNMAATGQLRPNITSWSETEREILPMPVPLPVPMPLPMPLPPPPPHITELLKSEEERLAVEAANAAAEAANAAVEAANAAAEAVNAAAEAANSVEAASIEEQKSLSSLLESAVTGLDPLVIERCQDAIAKLQDVRIKQGRFIVTPNACNDYQKPSKFEPSQFQPWQSTLHRSVSSKIQFTYTKQPVITYSQKDTSPSDSSVESLLCKGSLETVPSHAQVTHPTKPAVGSSQMPPHQAPLSHSSMLEMQPLVVESAETALLHSGSFLTVQSQTARSQATPPETSPPHTLLLQSASQSAPLQSSSPHTTLLFGSSDLTNLCPSDPLASSKFMQTQQTLNLKISKLSKELTDLKKMLDSKAVLQKNAATQTVERYPPPCQTCQSSQTLAKQGLLPTPQLVQDSVPKPSERYTPKSHTNQGSDSISTQSVPQTGVPKEPPALKSALKKNPTSKPTPIPQPVPPPTATRNSVALSTQTSTLQITPTQSHSTGPTSPVNTVRKVATLPTPLLAVQITTRPDQLSPATRSTNQKPKPVLKKTRTEPLDYLLSSHQILGDDLVLNFMDYAGLNANDSKNAVISGLNIDGMLRIFTSQGKPVGEQVMILLGLSDMWKPGNLSVFRKKYAQLVGFLRKRCYHLLLIEPPPIPVLSKTVEYWKECKEFSVLLKSLCQSHSISVVWSMPLFLIGENTPDGSCYKNEVHLNAKGVQLLLNEIQSVLSDAKKRNAGMDSDDVQPNNIPPLMK